MKKLIAVAVAALTLGLSQTASAWWGDNWGNNNNGYYNDWPTWTPMYWMEEMFDSFDDNGFGGGNSPWGWNRGGYGAPYGYQQQPYGYGYQQPYGYSPYGYAPQQQAPAYQYSPYGYAPYGYAPQMPAQQAPVAPAAR